MPCESPYSHIKSWDCTTEMVKVSTNLACLVPGSLVKFTVCNSLVIHGNGNHSIATINNATVVKPYVGGVPRTFPTPKPKSQCRTLFYKRTSYRGCHWWLKAVHTEHLASDRSEGASAISKNLACLVPGSLVKFTVCHSLVTHENSNHSIEESIYTERIVLGFIGRARYAAIYWSLLSGQDTSH